MRLFILDGGGLHDPMSSTFMFRMKIIFASVIKRALRRVI